MPYSFGLISLPREVKRIVSEYCLFYFSKSGREVAYLFPQVSGVESNIAYEMQGRIDAWECTPVVPSTFLDLPIEAFEPISAVDILSSHNFIFEVGEVIRYPLA